MEQTVSKASKVLGEDGHTPVITIQNGNWHIDGVDSGKSAVGVKGDTGNGIASITKTGTEGLVDTYTITFTNGTTTTFTVTNGKSCNCTPVYLLSFDYNGADGSFGAFILPMAKNDRIGTLPTPKRTHYTFSGWKIDGTTITENSLYNYEGNKIAVAQWREAVTYTVTFVADGVTVATRTYSLENTNINIPDVPEKSKFDGAWEDFELTGSDIVVNAVYTPGYSKGLFFSLNTDQNSYYVKGLGSCSDSDISIPPTYNGKPVTSIDDSAFYNCTGLTSITIPSRVTSIGNSAFWGCSGLESITIPDSVTSIGNSAFSGCTGLTNITIGSGMTDIGERAFFTSRLESITFNGTKAQWKAIRKGNNWNYNTPDFIVTCTDGTLTKFEA